MAFTPGMPHRTFTDAAGVTWEVWDVRPGRLRWAGRDRRSGLDRRLRAAPGLDPAADERRVPERRGGAVSAGLGGGWLAFRAGARRRRLAPIPPGWPEASDAALAGYCRDAGPVPGAPP